jgi:ketosteroid isomerase-like protein
MEAGALGNDNLKTVRMHYTAFASGDIDGILSCLDENVCIEVHDEHGAEAEEPMRGRDAARSFFEGLHEALTNTTVEVESLRADGDRVLARVTLGGTLRATGITGAIPAVHLFTVHDGLITEIRTHRPNWRDFDADVPIKPV